MVQTVQRIMETPQLPCDTVVDVLCRDAEADPHGQVTMKIPQLLFDKVVHVPVVQVERVPHMLAWRRQSCSGVSTASCGMKLIQDVLA